LSYLSKEFLAKYDNSVPNFGPVGEIVFMRTYAREGENWQRAVARVVNGIYGYQKEHLATGVPFNHAKAVLSAEKMYDHMYHMRFLPPGRGLRNCGTRLKAGGASLNNCGFVSTSGLLPISTWRELADPFAWAMDMLMLGVGVGFDLPSKPFTCDASCYGPHTIDEYVVSDSREGHVNSLRELFRQFSHNATSPSMDYSLIRPEGAPISSGGKAPGARPLKEMHEAIFKLLLNSSITGSRPGQRELVVSGALVNDVFALVGRCVVSGGVRRSAEITLISNPTDYDLKCKDKYPEENANYRWASNHSITLDEGFDSDIDYSAITEATNSVDELGIFWRNNAQSFSRMGRGRPDNLDAKAIGTNPCAEQTLEHKELCCLVEVFPTRCTSEYEFQSVLKYAYLYAKTVSLVPVHDKTTNTIVARNRRIGCSLTGIQQAIAANGAGKFYSMIERGYKYLKQLDARYSTWMQIPTSIKITSVKPSGTVSKLPGVTSGMHFPPARHYWQVIRFASNSEYLPMLREAGYRLIDLDPAEPNTTAVYFGVTDNSGVRAEHEVSAWEQMEHAAKLQHYWADNQVSVTVSYKEHERDQIPHMLAMYADRLKSVSFFPSSSGTHTFQHAPWQPEKKEIIQEYIANLKHLDYAVDKHEVEDEFCSGGSCTIER